MRFSNLTLSMAVASAHFTRDLEDSAGPTAVRNDFVEVETIPYDDENVNMSVYVAATDYLFSDSTTTDVVVQLEFYDILLGHLVDGSYYQTYYQFESPVIPGMYESFTCTATYNSGRDYAEDFGVRTYEGAQTFDTNRRRRL